MTNKQFGVLLGVIVIGVALVAGILLYQGRETNKVTYADPTPQTEEVAEGEPQPWVSPDDSHGRPPNFDDFLVPVTATASVAPDFSSNPDYAQYRTVITNAVKNGPNAAGHYVLVNWGCGTSCQGNVAVDALTGKIIALPGTASGIQGRLNSSLLIANPEAWPEQGIWPGYYVLADGKLTLIYSNP